ncbi:MAG: hypothetical protein K8T89_10740 [Planctomycetes bacterium]|nr:hypothetical protein [Planctomycetota bacterium]
MFRRLLPLVILTAIAFGCSKKNAPVLESGKGSTEQSDPNAAYTIKFRESRKGDEIDVVKARIATATVTNKSTNTTQTQKEDFRYAYTEKILDTSPDEPRPTKVTRVYSVSRKANPQGETKTASHIGKTISIERFMQGYKYAVDGASLPPAEQVEIGADFNKGQWKIEQTLPKTPVKIGEEWAGDFSAISAISGKALADYHKEKSKIAGKLVRVYQKDGRQWGVIEIKIRMVIDTVAANGSPVKGEINTDVTFDIVIDGSHRAGSMKIKLNGSVDSRNQTGQETTTTIDGTEEQSLTPVS